MLHNPNPFTELQSKFLNRIHEELAAIRNPEKDVLDNRDFELYLEHTKTFGTIPKIRFIPNTQTIKEKIMSDVGYTPVTKKDTWQKRRDQAAGAFDKHWDNLMFRLKKAGVMFARLNELFTADGENVSELIHLIQLCINPKPLETKIYPKSPRETKSQSYTRELSECEHPSTNPDPKYQEQKNL